LRPLEGVRELRERRMFSQQELAHRAGVSLFTIQRIERGEGSVRPSTGRAVATALGVGVEDLLPKAPAPTSSPKETDEERRANTFDMVHAAVVRQAKEERQAFARAEERAPLVENISQHPENEVFKQLVQLPIDQLADLSIAIMKYAVELEQGQRAAKTRDAEKGATTQDPARPVDVEAYGAAMQEELQKALDKGTTPPAKRG
jgi:transcriptional regulator with XRE-family HTH domain